MQDVTRKLWIKATRFKSPLTDSSANQTAAEPTGIYDCEGFWSFDSEVFVFRCARSTLMVPTRASSGLPDTVNVPFVPYWYLKNRRRSEEGV